MVKEETKQKAEKEPSESEDEEDPSCNNSSTTETSYYEDVSFMFDGELEPGSLKKFSFEESVRVSLHVVDDEPGSLQSGHYLWPAAPALAKYLVRSKKSFNPRSLLELGAGAALPSLTSLQIFTKLQCLVVTDHDPGTLERARDNYETTLEDLMDAKTSDEEQLDCINDIASTPIEFEVLKWGNEDGILRVEDLAEEHMGGRRAFDLVLGSDLIYCNSVIEPLLKTASLLLIDKRARFLLAQSFVYDKTAEEKIDKV